MKRVKVTEEIAYGSSALDRLTGTERPEPTPGRAAAVEETGVSIIKLSVFLRREEDAYLEGLASTAKFSGGRKISKTKLIEAMVRAFRGSNLDVRGVKTDDELFDRVVAQLR
jgi:hypothetical protein